MNSMTPKEAIQQHQRQIEDLTTVVLSLRDQVRFLDDEIHGLKRRLESKIKNNAIKPESERRHPHL